MNLVDQWWNDPQASASLFIAAVAACFAIYQLRALPAERRRRILDAMLDKYKESAAERGRILREMPALMAHGYEAVHAALNRHLIEQGLNQPCEDIDHLDAPQLHLESLQRDAVMLIQPDLGLSYTAAHEIEASEFKFRALMWCIETIRNPESSEDSLHLSPDLIETARRAVDKLNDFCLEYQNGAYPARIMLGQIHRSLILTAKALEPIVWEGKGTDGRWGRRIVRLGIVGQHFNDVTAIHRVTEVTWTSKRRTALVVHPAMTRPILGREVVVHPPQGASHLFLLGRLRLRAQYWRLVGALSMRPRFWWAYGGSRLRMHERAERQLGPKLNFAIEAHATDALPASLNFAWTLDDLPAEMAVAFKRQLLAARAAAERSHAKETTV